VNIYFLCEEEIRTMNEKEHEDLVPPDLQETKSGEPMGVKTERVTHSS
jgi:hypothetical protein